MTALPTSAKFGLLGAVLLIVVLAGWFGVVGPKRSEASKLHQQIADTQTKIAQAQSGNAQSRASGIRVADLFKLSRAMPDRADMPNVLLQLSDTAAETGVSFQSITPHDPVLLGSYEQIAIDLVFQGHFYDLSDFLFRLRNLPSVHKRALDATGRLFSVDSISFDQGDLKFPQVKATLAVSAYVFGDGTASPPVPAGAYPAGLGSGSSTPATAASESDSQPIPAAPPGATAAGR
jgi:hypothetical protein